MRATDLLKKSTQTDWDAATDHPFCKELADGTLPLDKMRWYLVQDYKFIDQFVRLLATAIAHAPKLADRIPMAQFLGLVTSTENTYFLRSFEALEVSTEDQNAPAAPATRAFQDLMHAVRTSGRYEQMLAVLIVAGCCQTNSNTSQSTTITQIYEAQIWNHSVRAALRFCL